MDSTTLLEAGIVIHISQRSKDQKAKTGCEFWTVPNGQPIIRGHRWGPPLRSRPLLRVTTAYQYAIGEGDDGFLPSPETTLGRVDTGAYIWGDGAGSTFLF